LAKACHEVVVYEKMLLLAEEQGKKKMVLHLTWGRWYWMPDFDRFFDLWQKKTTDYYELISFSLLIAFTSVEMNLLQSQTLSRYRSHLRIH
jgi:hypothetical protein